MKTGEVEQRPLQRLSAFRIMAAALLMIWSSTLANAQVVDRVEFVQTIQTLQTLADLQKSLEATGQPPTPLFASKPTAIRVYTLPGKGAFTIGLTLPGNAAEQSSKVTLGASTVAEQRFGARDGSWAVQTFEPPEGDWIATLRVLDKENKVVQGPITFKFTQTKTQKELQIALVFVCDAKDQAGKWQCPVARSVSEAAMKPRLSFLTDLFPTHKLTWTHEQRFRVELERSKFPSALRWFNEVLKQIGKEAEAVEKKEAPPADVLRFYLGLARPDVKGDIAGIAGGIPSRTALALAETTNLGTTDTSETWGHEIGHGLDLRHTNTDLPKAQQGRPPGCYLRAADAGTYWTFGDNRIQSANGIVEIGYRPKLKTVVRSGLSADNMLELMGYCLPQWISPVNYARAGAILAKGTALPPLNIVAAPASEILYWLVSGTISAGSATIDPLFFSTLPTPPDFGSGSFTIRVQDRSGFTLFERNFEPAMPIIEQPVTEELFADPFFHLIVPAFQDAARIVILNSSGQPIGQKLFNGSPPVVAIQTPSVDTTLSGTQTVSWTAFPSGPALTYRVEYSPDLGTTWHEIGPLSDTSVLVDFDELPGTSGSKGVIRVQASDGVNIGVGVSPAFAVTKKRPSDPIIALPEPASAYGPHDLVVLEGGAFDGDDGILGGSAIQWSSSIDGPLGTGQNVVLPRLSPGHHVLTLTATDSDSNQVSSRITADIAAGPPSVSIVLDQMNGDCFATIQAQADPNVMLADAAYSVDGGETYSDLLLPSLPYQFQLAGTGVAEIIARVSDNAGQLGTGELQVIVASCTSN